LNGPAIAIGLLALFLLLAVAGPSLWPVDPIKQLPDGLDGLGMPLPPSWAHPFGTDDLGRDALARWLMGTRLSLWVGVSATVLAGLLGGTIGVLAGAFKGLTDLVLMRVTEIVMAFPTLLLAIALASVLPPSPWMVILTLALVGWTAMARLVRSAALSVAEQEYIQAARSLGASEAAILLRHVVPNVLPTLLPLLALKLADMLLLEAALSYLGIGIRPPASSWGSMIQEGQLYFRDAPWLVVAPGLAIVLVVLSANLLGDRFGRLGRGR
jgi:ABC-type dipeptide/oligopeptide/nickel transport system permease subunit